MSLNVAGLTAYTNENLIALMKIGILRGRTADLIAVQPGIKSSAAINLLNSTLVAQAGSCGFNPQGTTALTQREIPVCPLKVNESICLDTLETYYTQTMMKAGSYNTEIPFEQIFAEEKAEKIQALVEDLIWKGDTTGSGNLALCDGFIRLFTALGFGGTGVINGNPTGITVATGITSANVVSIINGMLALQSTDTLDLEDNYLFVGYDVYRLYAAQLRTLNLFHYDGADNQEANYMMYVPGTNVRIVAVRGLNSTSKLVLSPASNLVLGTDLLSDYENFSIWFSEDNDEVRFKAKWKQGVQVAVPGYVVYFRLVP